MKDILTGKEETKQSKVTDNMIVYVENLKESITKFLELVGGMNKVVA